MSHPIWITPPQPVVTLRKRPSTYAQDLAVVAIGREWLAAWDLGSEPLSAVQVIERIERTGGMSAFLILCAYEIQDLRSAIRDIHNAVPNR